MTLLKGPEGDRWPDIDPSTSSVYPEFGVCFFRNTLTG